MAGKISISDDEVTALADMFRLMSDPSRLRILFACLEQPISVGSISEKLKLSQSLVSHHLRLLRATRVLKSERHGKQIFYSAADDHIIWVLTDMAHHVAEPAPATVILPAEEAVA
jgi:DNA-binding transcriptional ArsR family regulator